jgi:hypothetical protein
MHVLGERRSPSLAISSVVPRLANVLPLTCGMRVNDSTAREGRARARPGAVRCSGLLASEMV